LYTVYFGEIQMGINHEDASFSVGLNCTILVIYEFYTV